MPISIDKVKPLRLLKTQFYTPFIKENKRHGSAIFLITPNLDSSIKVLNSKLMVNMRLFYSYYMNWQASYMVRDFTISNEEMGINEAFSYPKPRDGHPMMTSDYCYMGDKLFFFAEATAENVMDTRLRKLLYNQRLKTIADLKPIYTKVKNSVDGKMIKYAYHTIDKYKNMNLFVDNSYYFKLFFDNNTFKRDMAIDIVYSLMDRFINSSLFAGYKRQTVIIPVDEWVREMNIEDPFDFMTPTPISMIYRLFKLPKETDEEKVFRKAEIQRTTKQAALVPYEIGKLAYTLLPLTETVIVKGNINAITDGMIAVINARSAVKSAFLNVKINLGSIQDAEFVKQLADSMEEIEAVLDAEEQRLLGLAKV